ncbi:hypothetical protein C8F04DRAFT_1301073 [Mycena alexandri]|uniref:C2H2-type domain-containing protein n=1 Tax=Mycena alexandri TaxID=1745969 RepID=A0AAD6XAT0_9AGAR|nr:hypothetical protein C8F04DRAFT_1301073 [Mycena alexandri]
MSSIASTPQSLFSTSELVFDDRLYDFQTDVFAGSTLYDLLRAEETARVFVPRAAPAPVLPKFDLSLQTVEEIFADLHEACSPPSSDDPLVLPPRPFYPYDPAETEETEEEEAAAPVAIVEPAAVPMYESEDSSSESESDSEYCGGCQSDAESLAETSTPRVLCALPGRVVPKSSLPASHHRAAPLSVALTPTPSSKKRKARKPRMPAAKKRAVPGTSTSSAPVAVAVRPATTTVTPDDEDLPPPPHADRVPQNYWSLLRLGCIPLPSGGMSCYKVSSGCPLSTKNFADMKRHVLTHNRAATQVHCVGCPQTFSRDDALKRHVDKSVSTHTSAHRRNLLVTFNEQQEIAALRETRPLPSASDNEVTQFYKKLNKSLNSKFDAFLKENRQS